MGLDSPGFAKAKSSIPTKQLTVEREGEREERREVFKC